MKKWILRLAFGVVALGLLAVLAVLAGNQLATQKMTRQVTVDVRGVPLRDDAASVERGRYLFASRGCADCHGAHGGGHLFLDDGRGLRIAGPNISPGPGTVVAGYSAADWERTIRHGVAPSGRPLLIMPSEDYNRLTNDDLAALVAYLRQLPPANGDKGEVTLPTLVRAFYGFGMIKDAAAKIDHQLPPAQPVAEGVTPAYGAYIANMCLGCHGPQLTGGKIPGGPPDWPAAADLRPGPGQPMARYATAEDFMRMFQSGRRPDGSTIKVMPFQSLKALSETDTRALYAYLATLPPR
jgi:cytochrome c553